MEEMFLKVRPDNSQELEIWKDAIQTYAHDPLLGLYKLRGLLILKETLEKEISKAFNSAIENKPTIKQAEKTKEWMKLVSETRKSKGVKLSEAMKIAKIEWDKRKMLSNNNGEIQSKEINSS